MKKMNRTALTYKALVAAMGLALAGTGAHAAGAANGNGAACGAARAYGGTENGIASAYGAARAYSGDAYRPTLTYDGGTDYDVAAYGVRASGVDIRHDGSRLVASMELDLTGLEVRGGRAALITPRLVGGADSLDLEPVVVYGRRRRLHYERNGLSPLTGGEGVEYKASDRPEAVDYEDSVPYEGWMDGAELRLAVSELGCCGSETGLGSLALAGYKEPEPEPAEFFPGLVYVSPEAEAAKERGIEGSAYIDFPANVTEIRPDYRRNAVELGKIRGTIDSVRRDPDVSITSVWLKGYASPEGRWPLNARLAEGRVGALRDYIEGLYPFPRGTVATEWEAEDWAGLRRWVEASTLGHRDEILSIIDGGGEASGLDLDGRDWRIRRLYPAEYAAILRDCYPALRHTDYRVSYTVRTYADTAEIRRVMASKPQNLSLGEMYLLAQGYEPGTEEFTEVFETAVRLYPDDEAANLNAANAAMRRGDHSRAAALLARAGNSAEAVYARAALAIRTGDLDTARTLLGRAADMGLAQASATLEELDERIQQRE